MTLVDLNSDCLRKIFEFCDLDSLSALVDVCRIMRDIIRADIFPKYKEFECVYFDGDVPFERAQIKKMINIGAYLRKLRIDIRSDSIDAEYDFFFYRIVCCTGPNIRELVLATPMLTARLLRILRPVFERLESLKVMTTVAQIDENIDCLAMSQKIIHLHMQGLFTFTPIDQPWPKLESLALGDNDIIYGDNLHSIFVNNPQLKRLKVSVFNADLMVEEVVELLPNLEEWTIFQNNSNLLSSNANQLQRLQRLSDLKILRIHRDDFNGIVQALAKCVALQDVKVQVYHEGYEETLFEPNHHTILTVAAELSKLKKFDISCCKLNPTFVTDFIKFASDDLKELHLHNCEVQPTDQMITSVVQQVTKQRRRKEAEGKADVEPLKICTDRCTDESVMSKLKDPNNQKFVKFISCNGPYEDQRFFD